jgi:hypothetical protein
MVTDTALNGTSSVAVVLTVRGDALGLAVISTVCIWLGKLVNAARFASGTDAPNGVEVLIAGAVYAIIISYLNEKPTNRGGLYALICLDYSILTNL